MKMLSTEKGFTLVEVLVALSIVAFVSAGISQTIVTLMRLSPQSTNWAVALRQVQDAGYWISRDVMMSDTVTPGTGDTFLTLTQPQISAPEKTILYQFDPMSGGLKRLMRDDAGQETLIAEYISNATATYDPDNCTLTFTIEATSDDVIVTRQYEATQRVPPDE